MSCCNNDFSANEGLLIGFGWYRYIKYLVLDPSSRVSFHRSLEKLSIKSCNCATVHSKLLPPLSPCTTICFSVGRSRRNDSTRSPSTKFCAAPVSVSHLTIRQLLWLRLPILGSIRSKLVSTFFSSSKWSSDMLAIAPMLPLAVAKIYGEFWVTLCSDISDANDPVALLWASYQNMQGEKNLTFT